MLKNLLPRRLKSPDNKNDNIAVTQEADNLAIKALYKSAVIFATRRDYHNAIEFYQHIISINPNYPEIHTKLGDALRESNKFVEAMDAYQTAITLYPKDINAYLGLGIIFHTQNNYHNALNMYEIVIAFQADNKLALKNIGYILIHNPDKITESLSYFNRTIALDPTYVDAYVGLGAAYLIWGKPNDAIPALEKAAQLAPNSAIIYSHLGWAFYLKGQLPEAKIVLEKAMEMDPNLIDSREHYAVTLLKMGNFKDGWPKLEVRWQTQMLPIAQKFASYQQLRKGDSIHGKTVLLITEQGIGDTLQFIRYVKLIVNHGGRIILCCEPEIIELLSSVDGISQIIGKDDSLPSFDIYCPLMNLPLVFNTTLDTVPADIPYITPNNALVEQWQSKLSEKSLYKVGLVWSGSTRKGMGSLLFFINERRSITLNHLLPLNDISNVEFYSLQKGEPSQQVKSSSFNLIDHTDQLNNFADTAALIANLDLVITVCTSVAHLAAAMGKPTWILLHTSSCWRWLTDRDDSPWYPTVRLFRQDKLDNWDIVINNVKTALIEFVKK